VDFSPQDSPACALGFVDAPLTSNFDLDVPVGGELVMLG
jgi:hypothetical protein